MFRYSLIYPHYVNGEVGQGNGALLCFFPPLHLYRTPDKLVSPPGLGESFQLIHLASTKQILQYRAGKGERNTDASVLPKLAQNVACSSRALSSSF